MPDLPPETWLEIFDWTTDIPGALDTSLKTPFESRPSVPHLHHLLYYEAKQTQRNIALVCRTWNGPGLASLYKVIKIDNERQLQSLLVALTTNKADPSRYTQRFDLAPLWGAYEAGEGLPVISQVLKLLSNLIVTRMTVWGTYTWDWFAALFVIPRHALRVLSFTGFSNLDRESYPYEALCSYLRSTPQLEEFSLTYPSNVPSTLPLNTMQEPFVLNHLHTLKIPLSLADRLSSSDHPHWHLPSLKYLMDADVFPSVPQTVMPSITHVGYASIDYPIPSDTRLVRIPPPPATITDADYNRMGLSFSSPVSFSRVALCSGDLGMISHYFGVLKDQTMYPKLAVIRLVRGLPPSSWQHVVGHPDLVEYWSMWIKFWRERGVRLEDQDGMLMGHNAIHNPDNALDGMSTS